MTWKLLVIGVALLVPGCGQVPVNGNGDGDEPPGIPAIEPAYPLEKRCSPYSRHGPICLADPDSHDAQYMRQEYNLTQVNQDRNREFGPRIDGEWVAAQFPQDDEHGRAASDIYAFNLLSRQFVAVAAGPGNHSTRHEVSDGRVVLSQEKVGDLGGFPRFGMLLWNSTTGERRLVESPLDGEQLPTSFDGSWVAVETRGNSNVSHDGVWAVNVDDGRAHQLWIKHAPGNVTQPNPEDIEEAAVTNGKAYWGVRVPRGDTGFKDLEIREMDLEAGESRVVVKFVGREMSRMDADWPYVVWGEPSNTGRAPIQVLDLRNNTAFVVSNETDGFTAFPRVGGEWVVYDNDNQNQDWRGITAVHVPSGLRLIVLNETVDRAPEGFVAPVVSSQQSDTDGKRVMLEVFRNFPDRFENTGSDLYWRFLPEISSG